MQLAISSLLITAHESRDEVCVAFGTGRLAPSFLLVGQAREWENAFSIPCVPIHLHRPIAPLDACIDVICLCEDYRVSHAMECILPDGRTTLVIRLDKDELRIYQAEGAGQCRVMRGALLSGPHSRFHQIDTECQKCIMTVHFKPGGAFPFFGVPANELCNSQVPLDALWGAEAASLRERLMHTESTAQKFNVLEAALLRRLKQAETPSRVVQFALQRFQSVPVNATVTQVADESGLSERHLVRLFRQEVGLTPKIFSRVRRFHEVLNRLKHQQDVDWADVAFDCGFYDQAHFIHEFRAFCGLSPARYLLQRGEHLLHLPLA
jgi:AraC-like DNA-binding protein